MPGECEGRPSDHHYRENRAVLEKAPAMAIVPEAVTAVEPEPEGADIMDVHVKRSIELCRGVWEFAEQNPEIAAQLVVHGRGERGTADPERAG